MNEQIEVKNTTLSDFYDKNKYSGLADLIKFCLMPFVFFAILGFPTFGGVGNYVSALSNFASLSFFILCGFFTLTPDRNKRMRKITRALKRSAIFAGVLFVVYIALNIVYLAYIGGLEKLASPEFSRMRTFFNFFVLNMWPLPIGVGFWFIQSLLYAYLFFFVAEKLKLYKSYVPVLIVLYVFMVLTGELAAISRFSLFCGFLTRAIPFMIIGMLLRKYVDKLYRIPRVWYLITFAIGIIMAVGELHLLMRFNLLTNTDNMIGSTVMALSVCGFAVSDPGAVENFLSSHGRSYAMRMYALCEPISLLIWIMCREMFPAAYSAIKEFNSFICLAVCFFIAFFIGFVKYKIAHRREME